MDKTNIRSLRVAAGWTQEQFADVSGVPQDNISRIERGQVPSVLTAMRVARGLKTTVEQLFAAALRADNEKRKEEKRKAEKAERAKRDARSARKAA